MWEKKLRKKNAGLFGYWGLELRCGKLMCGAQVDKK